MLELLVRRVWIGDQRERRVELGAIGLDDVVALHEGVEVVVKLGGAAVDKRLRAGLRLADAIGARVTRGELLRVTGRARLRLAVGGGCRGLQDCDERDRAYHAAGGISAATRSRSSLS